MTKKLYTSYFAKKGRDPLAVAISAAAPSFFKGRWYLQLAPSWAIINAYKYGDMTDDEYVDAYLDLLINQRKLNAQQVVDDLADGSILLCYEKNDGSFCHRHIVAEWLSRDADVDISEWHEPSHVDNFVTF